MSKIVWFIVIAWVVRSVFSAVKKAIADAKAEIEADKAREAGAAETARAAPDPQNMGASEDPRAALMRMLAEAGVSPTVTKVVESRLDYGDAAKESSIDYDDTSDEDDTDYDDTAAENRTDYDDTASEDPTDYDDVPPPPPVVYAPPPLPSAYAIADDATSEAVNAYVLRDIESHMKPEPRLVPPVHGLDASNVNSRELVRDSVVLDVLLRRYPGNPFFARRR